MIVSSILAHLWFIDVLLQQVFDAISVLCAKMGIVACAYNYNFNGLLYYISVQLSVYLKLLADYSPHCSWHSLAAGIILQG